MWIFMDIPCLQSVGFLEGNEGDGQRADDSRLEQLFDMSYVSRVSHRCLLLQISLSRHHFCKRQPWIWNLSWTFTRLLLSTKLRKRANTININLWADMAMDQYLYSNTFKKKLISWDEYEWILINPRFLRGKFPGGLNCPQDLRSLGAALHLRRAVALDHPLALRGASFCSGCLVAYCWLMGMNNWGRGL